MKKTTKKYYTYAYLRADDTPYYIGKGTRYRAWNRNPNDRVKAPKDKSRILILKQFDDEAEALKHEVYMIAIYKRKIDGGILINMTPGGESGSFPKTEEHKRKIAESNLGVKRSAETRKRMSESAKKKVISPEHRAKLDAHRRAQKGKPWSKKRREAYEARWGTK